METGDKCKVTNFIIHLNIQHEQISAKPSSLIKQSILCLLRTQIFQILPENKVQRVIFPSRNSTRLCIAIEAKLMTYWVPDCVIPVYVILSLSERAVTKFTCWDMLCALWFLSIETKKLIREMFYFQAFPDIEPTCNLLLQHAYHLRFHCLPTTSCMTLEFIFLMHFLPQTLISTTLFLMFVQGHLQWNFWY